MSTYDLEHVSVKSGGGGTRDGDFFHMSIRSGSRARAACAAEAYDYIAREGRFDDPELDRAVYMESGNMPSWAGDDAREFWDAADLYERANARLFIAGVFSLPRGLDVEDRIDLARTFVRELSSLERLPYTFAIHAGEDQEGREHNPHAHVMLSERGDDGLERRPQDWFRQANRQYPGRGGAAKSRSSHCPHWIERIRERLANAINDRLRDRGRDERVDHRSYRQRGIDRQPGEHIGPKAFRIFERTGKSHRLEQAIAIENAPRELADLEARIERLEQLRANLVLEQSALDQGDEYPYRSAADEPSRDTGPER
jgi:hypothetical protein